MALTRDHILSVPDFEVRPVAVPEWGGTVYVRTITGGQAEQYYAALRGGASDRNVMARLVAYAACDERGNLLFRPEDIDALAARSFRALERVFDAAMQLNGMTDEAVEAEEKNSATAPTSGSGTD